MSTNEIIALQADVAILQKAFALFMRKSSIDDALAWSRAQADAKDAIVNDALHDLTTRIKTGRLRAESANENKERLMKRVVETDEAMKFLAEAGKVAPAKQLADVFYTAVREDAAFAKMLDWESLPSALRDANEF